MSTYTIYLNTSASVSVTVEADDLDEAVEKAYDEAPHGVCAQCSGWGRSWSLDLGDDWTESSDYEVDGEYVDPSKDGAR